MISKYAERKLARRTTTVEAVINKLNANGPGRTSNRGASAVEAASFPRDQDTCPSTRTSNCATPVSPEDHFLGRISITVLGLTQRGRRSTLFAAADAGTVTINSHAYNVAFRYAECVPALFPWSKRQNADFNRWLRGRRSLLFRR